MHRIVVLNCPGGMLPCLVCFFYLSNVHCHNASSCIRHVLQQAAADGGMAQARGLGWTLCACTSVCVHMHACKQAWRHPYLVWTWLCVLAASHMHTCVLMRIALQDTDSPSLGHMAHHLVNVPKWDTWRMLPQVWHLPTSIMEGERKGGCVDPAATAAAFTFAGRRIWTRLWCSQPLRGLMLMCQVVAAWYVQMTTRGINDATWRRTFNPLGCLPAPSPGAALVSSHGGKLPALLSAHRQYATTNHVHCKDTLSPLALPLPCCVQAVKQGKTAFALAHGVDVYQVSMTAPQQNSARSCICN